MNFAAALLAGGRSSRMGRDKALLDWQGVPLWQHQIQTLRALHPSQLLLSVRGEQGIADAAAQLVLDPPGVNEGPLGGLVRCLRLAQQPLLMLAIDMPRMTANFLRDTLIARGQPERGVVFRGSHGFEPLAALYPLTMLPRLEASLRERRLGLQSIVEAAVAEGLLLALDIEPQQALFFHNVNTPADIDDDKFSTSVSVTRLYREGREEQVADAITREEPLQIRVNGRDVAVVMRTPGHDRELAAGFLISEGVLQRAQQIVDIIKCTDGEANKGNVVDVLLDGGEVDWNSLSRQVFSASSCGMCGKTSIASVFQRFEAVVSDLQVSPERLWSLPDKVRAAQDTFAKTGGLHACAIFDLEGNLVVLREDVGRHNALDKVLGYGLMQNLLPFDRHILLLSGRVSFEMMQKALAAGVPLVAAISAPSSLAVEFAESSNQTLVGFLREKSMNIYAHGRRVKA